MSTTNEELNRFRNEIASHLQTALTLSIEMQKLVHDTEGDSELYRKLAFYLTPSLQHWLVGQQAGSMRDLAEIFWKREQEKAQAVQRQQPGLVGDGHEVVTSKKKKK